MRRKRKAVQDDSVVISCPKCGHKHPFASLAALEKMPLSTPCAGCGFLFLHHIASKIDATMALIQSDTKAGELLRDGKIEAFEKYLKEKTGL